MRSRIHALLAARVRALLEPRATAQAGIRAQLAALSAEIAPLEDRLRAAQRQARALGAELRLWSEPFHAEMTVHQAWLRHPGARGVFTRHHLPACDRCAVRFEETVAEAAAAYRLDLPRLLDELNALLGGG